jgi:hypothetical protein
MSTEYQVRVGYVDDTYWDDGSRCTSEWFSFKTQKEAVAFAQEATTKGCLVRGRNGELHVRPKKDDILVRRRSTTEVKW